MPEELSVQYSRDEVIARLRVDPGFAGRLWNAFGFAQGGGSGESDGFTEEDLAALAVFVGNDREMDPSTQIAAARAIGQATARLAEWEAEQIRLLGDDPRVPLSRAELIDAVAHIQDLVWRRHIDTQLRRSAAVAEQSAAAQASAEDDGPGTADAADDGPAGDPIIVGFADIVGYTALSRRLGLAELEELLEAFESAAHRIITAHDGQVIKSIGDAVMFTAPSAEAAAEIALELHALTSDGTLPVLRIGIAAGRALTRMGDVFGEPVNIAARLAGAARAGTTLVDEQLAEALGTENEEFTLHHISALTVRGYRRLRAFALTRRRPAGRHRASASGTPDGRRSGAGPTDDGNEAVDLVAENAAAASRARADVKAAARAEKERLKAQRAAEKAAARADRKAAKLAAKEAKDAGDEDPAG